MVAIAARYCTDSFVLATILAPPSTLAGLANVNGVGETKLAKYGQQILDLLAAEA